MTTDVTLGLAPHYAACRSVSDVRNGGSKLVPVIASGPHKTSCALRGVATRPAGAIQGRQAARPGARGRREGGKKSGAERRSRSDGAGPARFPAGDYPDGGARGRANNRCHLLATLDGETTFLFAGFISSPDLELGGIGWLAIEESAATLCAWAIWAAEGGR